MNWLDKLEKRIGKYAVKGLMSYIVGLNAFVFLMMLLEPRAMEMLILIPSLVMKGEVWRLLTYLFIPPVLPSGIYSFFWIFFALYFYMMIGRTLEHEWGSFRFNLFYLLGVVGTTAAAFITGAGTTAVYLNLSMFLAFARLYPDYQILIFYVLPVKIKYLAWLNWAYFAYTVFNPFNPISIKAAVLVSVINYFIFFGKDIVTRTKTRGQAYTNRRRFEAQIPKNFTYHKCVVCGKTEKDDPKMDFRYCAECEGDYEYCMDHLYDHQHVRKEEKQ